MNRAWLRALVWSRIDLLRCRFSEVAPVVLILQVGTEGWVSDVHVITSSLDEPSVKAAKLWTFLPARNLGKPVQSTTTLALVYLPFINKTLKLEPTACAAEPISEQPQIVLHQQRWEYCGYI